MSTPQHTPGPWEVKNDKVLSRTNPHAGLVAHIYEKGNQLWDKNNIQPIGWDDVPQRQANARLIAAAPELLAVLKSFVADYEHCDRTAIKSATFEQLARNYAEIARAVIAKATGEV